jgi:hypothetical protein
MTTTPAPSITSHLLTGTSVGPFATGWKYADAADVRVWIETAGVAAPSLTAGTDYTLTGSSPLTSGGTVTLAVGVVPAGGWPADTRLILRRRTARRQGVALPDNEGHKPRATERALDKQMLIAEEDRDDLDRALVMPPGAAGGQVPWTPGAGVRFVTLDETGAPRVVERPEDFDGLNKANLSGDNLAEEQAAAFRDVLKLGPTDDVKHQSVSGERFVAAGGLGRFGGSNDPGGIILGRGDPRSGPTDGAKIGPDGHGNWVHVETTRVGNPTEFIVYSKALSGRAQGLNGTNVIERLEGDDVTPIAEGDTIYFAGRKLKVTGKPAYGRLAVSLYPSGSITFDTTFANEFYKWCYTTGDGVANIVGGQVKYVSGTPFPPLFFSDFSFTVNGVTYTASQLVFVDQATYGFTGTPPGNASNVAFAWRGNINDQVTTLRLQLEQGINEENLNVFAFAGHPTLGRGFYMTQDWAGLGKNRPFYIGSDDWSPGDPKVSIGVYPSLSQHDDAANRKVIPDGGDFVTLGGHAGNEALRVLNSPTKVSGVNRWDVAGAPTGFYPSLRVRGLDANIDLGLDAKGSGGLRVTQDFTRPVLHANAPPGLTAYPEINGGEGVVYVVAKPHGAGVTVADLALTGSGGLGRVRIGTFVAGAITPNGSIEIRTLAGETFLISGQKL